MTKVVSPRPLGDASMVTQKRKYAACAGRPGKQSDGQMVQHSADIVLLARAGCAVCADPVQETVTLPCVCPTVEGAANKPLAYQGSPASYPGHRCNICPNHTPADPSLVAVPPCCATNGNTWLANDIPPTPPGGWPLPPCKPVALCPAPPMENPCCTEDGFLRPGYDGLYWDSAYLLNQDTQAPPCGSC